MPFAFIYFLEGRADAGLPSGPPGHADAGLPGWERPTDPGYGRPDFTRPGHWVPGSANYPGHWVPGSIAGHPDAGLPVGPQHPGNWVPGSIAGHPGAGLPVGPQHPSNWLPGLGHASGQPLPPMPPSDPGYGIEQGGNRPDQGPAPPITIYPPLDGVPPGAMMLVWILGVGYRWITMGDRPDAGLPSGPPGHADTGLPPNVPSAGPAPTPPPVAGQPLPPTAAPRR